MENLNISLHSRDDKVKFSATARDNPEIVIDYSPPIGTGEGYTSLELLMASYGSCVSTTVLTILRHQMRKKVDGISVDVQGVVRDEHPKALERMNVALNIKASDLSEPEVRQALAVAEEKLCPVWAMIKGNVEIDIEFLFLNKA